MHRFRIWCGRIQQNQIVVIFWISGVGARQLGTLNASFWRIPEKSVEEDDYDLW